MAEPAEERVKGGAEDLLRAAEGMKLFDKEEAEYDTAAATKFKEELDVTITKLSEAAAALTGKDNKKARTEKEKEVKALKDQKDYVDACKIIKGLPPPNGNFVKKAGGPTAEALAAEKKAKDDDKAAAEAKDAKAKEAAKPKKEGKESAGISKEERDELEKLKNDIIARKTELKAGGMSGGQMNKDETIVGWVKRMNDLKEKQNPGALAAEKADKKPAKKRANAENSGAILELEKEIEEYQFKLAGPEFKYTKKEIAADPDMADMKKRLAALSK